MSYITFALTNRYFGILHKYLFGLADSTGTIQSKVISKELVISQPWFQNKPLY